MLNNCLIHERTRIALENRLGKHGNIILRGPKGMGKWMAGLELAAAELGTSVSKLNESPVFHIIKPEKGSFSVEMLEKLKEETCYQMYDRYLVIIDDADLLNDTCQDRLLKSLEEDADTISYILICHSKMNDTIMSRCICIDFPRFSIDEVLGWAKEENNAALLGCNGTPGMYLFLQNEEAYKRVVDELIGLFTTAKSKDEIKRIFDITGYLKENSKDCIYEVLSEDALCAVWESIYQIFLSTVKINCCVREDGLGVNLKNIYSEDEILFISEKCSECKHLLAMRSAKKDDIFLWLMYFVSPKMFMDMEE